MGIIESLDFLGTKPTLLINRKPSCKSKLGGILSISVTLILFTGSIYFLNLLFFRLNFVISQSEEYLLNSRAHWEDLEVSLILLDKLGMDFAQQDRLYGVTSMLWKYVPVINEDNSVTMKMDILPVKLEKCNVMRHFPNNIDLWKGEKFIEKSYCIVPNQMLNISMPYGYANYTTMMF